MPKIHQLSAHVVNKIAAGEVIERPASVVKELVENSLDAGATRIDVTLEQGGVSLIRVADNGSGIHPEDLPLAIASHATSKIRGDEELFSVTTLGFRGEALASIASVSRFRLESRTTDQDGGYVLQVDGGTVQEGISPSGGPVGTRVEVNDLFFNTPVRRKFLRTTSTELGHVTEAITRLALAFPQVHFVLRHQDRTLHDLPPTDSWRDRIAAFFGRELAEHLLWVEHRDDDLQLEGFVAEPSFNRANARLQYFFLNQRHIRDRSLQHALTEAYRGLIMTGRYPIAFLRLEMPPEQVDVNVHPTKLEVRFQDGGRIYSRILGTLRNKFLTSDITKSVGLHPQRHTQERQQDGGSTTPGNRLTFVDSSTHAATPHLAVPAALPLELSFGDEREQQARQDIRRWAESLEGTRTVPTPHLGGGTTTEMSAVTANMPLSTWQSDAVNESQVGWDPAGGVSASSVSIREAGTPTTPSDWTDRESRAIGATNAGTGPAPPVTTEPPPLAGPSVNSGTVGSAFGERQGGIQVHHRYLVCESEEGIVVIDQHALHERILYEQLRNRLAVGGLERQALLVPEPVELMPEEAAALIDAREMLQQLGLGIDDFGGATVIVNYYPAILRHFRPDRLLKELAELLLTGKKQLAQDDILDQLIHTMACKAAVKAGDRLTAEEVTELLKQRKLVQDWHHCPHGRPTTLVFKRSELDRYFGRT